MATQPSAPVSDFLRAASFAVAGASRDRSKYGNRVFRALLESGRSTLPINPAGGFVEEHPAYASFSELPWVPEALSVVTPPEVSRQIVAQAIAAGVRHIWFQPGAEDSTASQLARQAGLNVIDDGSCILVLLTALGPRKDAKTGES